MQPTRPVAHSELIQIKRADIDRARKPAMAGYA
jgi:hypothetical protein